MSIPAGWYPESSGSMTERWWDGNQWTEQTRPAATPPPPPTVPTATAPWVNDHPAANKSSWKRSLRESKEIKAMEAGGLSYAELMAPTQAVTATASSGKAASPEIQPQFGGNRPTSGLSEGNPLIVDLDKRGESILAENLPDGERIVGKLQGDFGQAIVLTDRRLYILKWGFQTGQTFGGKCTGFDYKNLTSVEMKKHAVTRMVVVNSASNQNNNRLSYWADRGKGNNAIEADNVVTFSAKADTQFQQLVNLARENITNAHQSPAGAPASGIDVASQLEKLASLMDRGLLTEEEFATQKIRLLAGGD
ncbi:hypothetical protein QO003_000048 [Arthrobacter silviterrae]|uniref:DUF2510 domain-containing protein n=1 Tax=Arthrobacter silviterrae TaxID=2026658 RepID=A0ABX0DCN2_9MICC|nr:DUF2510 domain-containing protein [Arthrobacter silviterrae]MDQ0275745.1 hypothetical protein [Arthrobacter silviterrae]NGN83155.1 DUF2510 domain-containing protein [Arthrobacter silviterrae]